jgi:plasmid maintenance system antidote protein VapI
MKYKVTKTTIKTLDVQHLLTKYRLTQTAVAQEVGISRTYMTDIVNEIVTTTEETAQKIIKAINKLK